MNDNILNGSLLVLVAALVAGACGSADLSARRESASSTVDMPVVMLPAVTVAGKRQAPAEQITLVANAGLPVVQLPPVEVSGRRVPTMETVTLARAQ